MSVKKNLLEFKEANQTRKFEDNYWLTNLRLPYLPKKVSTIEGRTKNHYMKIEPKLKRLVEKARDSTH